MHFASTTNQGEREEENETTTEIVKFTQKPKGQQNLKFGSPEFRAMLPEGRYGNSGAQLTLRPYPLSTGMPKGIQYSIIDNEEINNSGQLPLPFFVHSDSGDLVAFAEIDREEKSVYRFKVKAFDPSTNQNAETLVTVQILDVNDNFPHFLEPLIWTIPIARNTPYNTQLATFQAKDNDEGSHGRVHFKIEKDSSGGLFYIDGRSGQLFLAKNVPAENVDPRDQFEIIISALDGGRPSLRTEHHIRIEVFPEGNEFATPEFLRPEFNAGNISGAAAQNGTFIFQVTAGISKQICYELIDPPIAKLFIIDSNNGQIRMGRRPLDSERGHQWLLNISAFDCQQKEHQHGVHWAFTTVKVQLEQLPNEIIQTTTTTIGITKGEIDSETNIKENCHFSQKVYNTEITENTQGKQKLLNLNIIGNCENQQIHCLLNQSNDAFELNDEINENNNKYCEVFVIQSLDREKKSIHFLVINISIESLEGKAFVNEIQVDSSELTTKKVGNDEEEIQKRLKRKNGINRGVKQNNLKEGREVAFNGLVEQIKAKLADNQALIVIRVIDQNDNEPKINHLTSDRQIVFAVDWQTPVLQPIGRIQAFDPDEQPKQLQFYLEGDNSKLFSINSTSGVIQLMKSLQIENSDEYYLSVCVSDGEHTIQTPLTIYRLQPGTNIALLVINKPVDQVDVLNVVRHLNALLPSLDVDVLVKQVYIGENGLADPKRTHLLVYAQDKQTRIPLAANKLKELLESSLAQSASSDTNSPSIPNLKIADSPLQFLASVQVPDYGVWSSTAPFRLNPTEIILLSVSAFLVFGICTMLYLLLRCCKRKQELITKSDLEYMVDSQIAGPRPYNVELITRKAMQNAQNATLRLPEPVEDCTLTPESRATMLASSGIYSGGNLGGPLRRTNRVTTTESSLSEEGTPPQFSRSNMSNEQLIRGQQNGGLYGRNGDPEEPEYSPTIPRHQRLQNNYESGEQSPETMRSEAEEINVSPPEECPPPPPSSSPPELNGK
uniref:Cadherin domain-containing protein n=2 Tax=Meloidogyne incognita TaxID=6306 RepID=A0A914LYM9_MELIC